MIKFVSKNFYFFFSLYLAVYVTVFSFIPIKLLSYNDKYYHEYSDEEYLYFPDNFLWGSATASYQVEGRNFASNWWRFEQKEGNIKNYDSAEIAVDHYNLYKEDIALMKEMNLNSYRFSIEWSRIEPERGEFNYEEIQHYNDVLDELQKNNIKPMVTLWHFSLPIWFEDLGGWENSDSPEIFTEYVDYVSKNLGENIELWVTINEPMAYITSGYIIGKWPPAKFDIGNVHKVASNINKAHQKAYVQIHKNDSTSQVGLANYTSYLEPEDRYDLIENFGVFVADKLSNLYFIENNEKYLDFIGLHYYFKQIGSSSMIPDLLFKKTVDVESEDVKRIYDPNGLYQILMKFKRFGKPIYITELGSQDSYGISRGQFIKDHLEEIYYAINDGVDVKGVFYWSFIDNFEWSEGYGPKFGLVSVDLNTQERTIKSSSIDYINMVKCGCINNE